MKKLIALMLCVMMCLPVIGSNAAAGTYTGVGDSKQGGPQTLEVSVTVDEQDKVTEVVVTKNNETPGVGTPAIDTIPGLIVELQTANVDAVTGATYTSDAIMMAVKDAIAKAGLDVEAWSEHKVKTVEKAADETLEADVVVVGAGGAGMAAAVQANMNGASVIVVEKMDKVGGNTILAGGAMNAVDDRSETAIKYNDSVEWHYTQTMQGGDNQGDPVLVHTMVSKAGEAVQWLKDMGMEFKDDTMGLFTVLGGMWPRAHKPVMPVGTGFFDTYNKYIESHEGIQVILQTKAEKLTKDDNGRVNGVICTGPTGNTVTLKANKGVVMATGGFSANVGMRQLYNTQWADLGEHIKTTNHTGATGDGIKMMAALGADFIQMGNIQLLPAGDPVTGSLSGNIEHNVETRIFVNKEGNRFVNEGGRRDEMTAALFQQTDNAMWIVMDSDTYPSGDVRNNFNESIDDLIAAGRAVKGETLEELAEAMGVPADNLKATVEEFNKHVESKEPDEFGRTLYETPIDNGPFYAGLRVPTVHHTMGGVHINASCQVINENGQVIPGLFAAGEVTGGIHGANRLGGNALTDIAVFGRIAGENAAAGK